MSTKKASAARATQTQEVCIDLPGQAVRCWRSSDNIKVILRKHRDVFFDINLKKDAIYTVESKSEFYSPREKKLLRRVEFFDGERFNLWVGRDFLGCIVLKLNGAVIGQYEVNKLDATNYGTDPKSKPEPLMVIMGQKNSSVIMCTSDDPFGTGRAHSQIMPSYEGNLSILKDVGSQFNYTYLHQSPQIREYVAVTEASSGEIQPNVLAKLDSGIPVQGSADEIFLQPTNEKPSLLYRALFFAARNISGSEFLTGNFFKETAGYISQNFKELNKVSMQIHIEKKVKGKYKVALKGYFVSELGADKLGLLKKGKPHHINVPLGSKGSQFLDGGFARSGKAGYGGFKRIMTTGVEHFVKGMKIQGVGTVIDLIVDVNNVYLDERGSRDLSEFLGRAGISIAKAGATAALGSAFAAMGTAALTGIFAASAVPVIFVVIVVISGFVGAAMLVDLADDAFSIKKNVAALAR